MKNILSYFIKYPVISNAILLLILVFGYFGFSSTKTTFMPQIGSKFIKITAVYPGAAPIEIEEGIVLKIEDNLKGITGIERVTSVSSENSADITVEMKMGFNADVLLQEIKNAVDRISSFPVGMEPLIVFKQEELSFAISVAVHGDIDLKRLKDYARKMERDLLAVDGISKINLSGFPAEEIEIAVRESEIRKYGLSFTEVSNAISKSNIFMTGGKIRGKDEELLIRANTRGYFAEDIKDFVVRTNKDGAKVRLSDVAEIRDRWAENPNRVYFDNKPAVQIMFRGTNDEDIFAITNSVKEYIEQFNERVQNAKMSVVRDGSEIIKERIDILTMNGIQGLLLVLLFLTVFLNRRLAIWVAIAIPISFLGMFIFAPLYNFTFNVMSLLGMILVVGILVDDGIVIAENIFQHHERGKKPLQAALDGTKEVLPAVISAVLTTVIIFLAFGMLEGGMGERSKDIAFVVIVTLLVSLIEAAFILPAHIAHSKALHNNKVSKIEQMSSKFTDFLKNKIYAPILKFSLNNIFLVASIVTAMFVITLGAFNGRIIKTTFFPVLEFNNFQINLEMPSGTRENITDSILLSIEDKVREFNEEISSKREDGENLVLAITRSIGPGTNKGSLTVNLLESEKRGIPVITITNMVREKVGEINSAEKLTFGGNNNWGMPVSIALKGGKLEDLRRVKDLFKEELKKNSLLKDISDNDPPGLKEINVKLNQKAYALGLTSRDVISQVRQGFFGSEAQRVLRGIDEVRIWVRYEEEERESLENLKNMRVRLGNGIEYPLSEIADFEISRGVMTINHMDAERVITVEADVADPKASVIAIVDDIKENIVPKILANYPEISANFEGQSRENDKTMNAMMRVMIPLLLLMFMIVVVTFRSFFQALLVFMMFPLSLIGVAWGHYLQGFIISILSIFGIVALMGIIVNNSIVFITTMNAYLKNGEDIKTAVYNAGINRFRAVILTSGTTILGLAPLMFESSFQAQFLSPMAISLAYGLLISTFLTLIVLPIMLLIGSKVRVFNYRIFNSNKIEPEKLEPAVKEINDENTI